MNLIPASRTSPSHTVTPSDRWLLSAACALLLVCAAGVGRLAAQKPYVFHQNVREVVLHVTVLDKKGRPVPNLTSNNFKVTENRKPQRLDYFSYEDAPVSMGLLIDDSGSMRSKRAAVNEAALNFVRASNPGDEIFIVNFNDDAYLDTDFTNNMAKLKEGLSHIESRGGTAMRDAVVASLTHLQHHAKNDKRVLLLVTDGNDDASRESLEDTVRLASSLHGPMIYCIGLLSDEDRGDRRSATRALKALANATGGEAYFPKTLDQVDRITRQVAQDIRHQYALGYHSTNTAPGFRAVTVKLVGKGVKHDRVRARSGYYAGSGHHSSPAVHSVATQQAVGGSNGNSPQP